MKSAQDSEVWHCDQVLNSHSNERRNGNRSLDFEGDTIVVTHFNYEVRTKDYGFFGL
uniref:Uncharacterized protein n=1 Tax=Physcomitrium patens TaxID=3218 RepID=A0A2K1K6M4_PHYPA|nr:hypothetical protein PHYPA_011314 [Physcomitrium patens]